MAQMSEQLDRQERDRQWLLERVRAVQVGRQNDALMHTAAYRCCAVLECIPDQNPLQAAARWLVVSVLLSWGSLGTYAVQCL
jgi:hypothetical protein